MNAAESNKTSGAISAVQLSILAFLSWLVGATMARWVGLWIGIGSVAILLATVVLMTAGRVAVLPLLRPAPLPLLLGTLAGLVMVVVTHFAFPLAVLWLPLIAPSTATLYGAFGTATPFKLAVMILVILGEEIVWRGLVQGVLGQKFGVRAAVFLAALAYAVGHAPVGSPLLVMVALCCGLFWGALRAITKSLVPSVVSHILWDLAVLVWVPVLH